MQTHDLIQGSPEWAAHRASHFNASDAPAMLGCSPYSTRTALLHKLHTGLSGEVDPATQRRFDDGHRFEALARPLAAQIIGEDLYPVVGSDGELSASFDGLTMAEDTAFEHKSLNDELRAVLKETPPALPKQYRVQMEQQLLVSGAERVLFMASKWSGDTLVEEQHCWYTSDPALRAEIVAGWKQFAIDLAAYRPAEVVAAPVAKAVTSLPVVFDMRVEGKLVSCNLEKYKPAALAYIAAINTELTDDQQFADATTDAKFCRDSADKLELAIEQALGQMGDVNSALNTVREIAAAFDAKGLALEKLVESQKKAIKEAQVLRGQQALKDHISALNTRLGEPYMPGVAADFAGKIKGLRTVESLRNAIDTELARAKIEANAVADRIQVNMRALSDQAEEHGTLFPDEAQLVLKASDDLQAVISSRIAAHKAAEDKKAEAAKVAQPSAAAPIAAPATAPQAPAANSPLAPVAGNVSPLRSFATAGAPASPPTLKLGDVNARLQHFATNEAGLSALGFPATKVKGACLYHEADFGRMVDSMVAHLRSVQHELQAA